MHKHQFSLTLPQCCTTFALQGVQEGLEDLQTDWVTPEHVAEELTAIGFVTGGLLAVHRLLGLTPFKVWLDWRSRPLTYTGYRLCSRDFGTCTPFHKPPQNVRA